jgi:hypothetical protein
MHCIAAHSIPYAFCRRMHVQAECTNVMCYVAVAMSARLEGAGTLIWVTPALRASKCLLGRTCC